GRPCLFSTDPDHPAIRAVLEEGGRAVTVIDGNISVLSGGWHPRHLVALEDVPMTLAGISRSHIQNALGAVGAALGIGLSQDEVAEGLRTFILDPQTNPGRANLFEVDGRIVV